MLQRHLFHGLTLNKLLTPIWYQTLYTTLTKAVILNWTQNPIGTLTLTARYPGGSEKHFGMVHVCLVRMCFIRVCACVQGVLWDGDVLMSVYVCMCVYSNNNFETQLELEDLFHHKLNLKSNLNSNPNCNTKSQSK